MDRLDFQPPREANGRLTPAVGTWNAWFEGLARRPRFAGWWSGPEVCGWEGAKRRLGGYFVEPVESVLGLEPFDDCLEGTLRLEAFDHPVPYAFFEYEKLLRMILHDSDLAFEILSTPHWLETPDPEQPCAEPRRLVRGALTAGLVGAYRERAGGCVDGGAPEATLRPLATAAALLEGRVTLELEDALEVVGESGDWEDASALAGRLRDRLASASERLPTTARRYDELGDHLVELRLAHRRGRGREGD